MRIFQHQQESQRDQRAHTLHLFQQRHLRIALLRQFLDALELYSRICSLNDSIPASNGSSAVCNSGLRPFAFSGFMLRTLHPRCRSP